MFPNNANEMVFSKIFTTVRVIGWGGGAAPATQMKRRVGGCCSHKLQPYNIVNK